MSEERVFIKSRIFSPALMVVLTLLCILIVAGFFYFEYKTRRGEYLALLEKQSALFIGSISSSTQNAVAAAAKVENELSRHLRLSVQMLDRLDRRRPLTSREWHEQMRLLNIRALQLYSPRGELTLTLTDSLTAINPIPAALLSARRQDLIPDTTLVLEDGSTDHMVWLITLCKRHDGGMLTVRTSPEETRGLKNLLGIGYFLKRFQSDSSIEYLVIQNSQTIVSGSFKDYQLSSFAKDSLLWKVFQDNRVRSRIVSQNGRQIFETIAPFQLEAQPFGVLRLGLAMREYERLQTEIVRRLYLFLAVVVVFGLILANVLLSHRHRQLLNQDLRRLQAYTNSILENLMSGVVSFDHTGRITSINQKACWLLNLEAPAVLFGPLSLLPPELQKFTRTDQPADHHRIWLQAADLRKRLVAVRRNRIPGEADDDIFILLLDDVTDQTILEQQISRNQRLQAMRTLASSVAHEIRNPLNSIKLLVDLIKKKYTPASDGEGYRQRLMTVHSEIDRISHIVDQYLQFARMPRATLAPVLFPDLLDEVATLYDAALKEKRIDLHLDLKSHRPLRGDRNQLKQVFINLINNAVEAIIPPGEIRITGHPGSGTYEIRIQDSGHGIPEQDLPNIFDFHFTTKKGGSGIGLSVAQQIVIAHQGVLFVESEEGQGAVFILQFPLEFVDENTLWTEPVRGE